MKSTPQIPNREYWWTRTVDPVVAGLLYLFIL